MGRGKCNLVAAGEKLPSRRSVERDLACTHDRCPVEPANNRDRAVRKHIESTDTRADDLTEAFVSFVPWTSEFRLDLSFLAMQTAFIGYDTTSPNGS